MRIDIHCPQCNTRYQLEESAIPPQGAKLTCKSCGHRWETRRSEGVAAKEERTARAASESVITCPGCGLRFVPSSAPPDPASVSTATSAQRTAAPARPGQKTILVVEDVDYFTNLARETLGSKYRTIAVANISDARKILTRERVDLLVLDLTLQEGEDGRDLLRSLDRKDFPVLIFTARDESDMYGAVWKELQDLGADDMLIKGLNVEENLLQKVGALLSARR